MKILKLIIVVFLKNSFDMLIVLIRVINYRNLGCKKHQNNILMC